MDPEKWDALTGTNGFLEEKMPFVFNDPGTGLTEPPRLANWPPR